MIHIGQVFDRLLENGIAGHQPNNDLLPANGQGVEDPAHGSAGHKGLAAAGGHLHADMRYSGNGVFV